MLTSLGGQRGAAGSREHSIVCVLTASNVGPELRVDADAPCCQGQVCTMYGAGRWRRFSVCAMLVWCSEPPVACLGLAYCGCAAGHVLSAFEWLCVGAAPVDSFLLCFAGTLLGQQLGPFLVMQFGSRWLSALGVASAVGREPLGLCQRQVCALLTTHEA